MSNYREILTINPGNRFGRPCIRDTRISVLDVLGWLASGMSIAEIQKDFPELSNKDISACLSYAADRERIIRFARH